jgi:antitoxin component YwqK of YwqJK toxin-antitoxin module
VSPLLWLALAVAPFTCPDGTRAAGMAPPAGIEVWCERPDPAGRPRRHGPAREFYDVDLVHVESTWRDGQLDGPWTQYHRDGLRAAAGRYRLGERDGTWTWWYASGRREEEVTFDRGRRHGPFRHWWPNGQLRVEGRFCAGLQCGDWSTWNEDGALLGTVRYEEIRATP